VVIGLLVPGELLVGHRIHLDLFVGNLLVIEDGLHLAAIGTDFVLVEFKHAPA
jgi:hypothetical protein